jgi:hypothetical protein
MLPKNIPQRRRYNMSPRSKKEYLDEIYVRFKRASKQEKTIILDEFCNTCGYHRKHAIRLLNKHKRFIKAKVNKRGKPSIYNNQYVLEPLKQIWLAANLPCSKRLKAIIPLWLPYYAKEYGYLTPDTIKKLNKISPATIDRILYKVKLKYRGKGRTATKPGTLLKHHIPIKTNQWNEFQPGFIEADTVAHCGESLSGDFVYTIDFVDIATGWSEQRAVFGKGEHGVLEQIKDIESSLPFPILGFDSDNGSEFLNYRLMKYFLQRTKPVQFTRSRPYHKDDNAHIEQKNWTHIRQWLGYQRLDNPDTASLLNQLYTMEWRLFHNFFCPSVKLIEKKLIASKTIKRYDKPKTPYQRLLESSYIKESVKEKLKEQYNMLNPFTLRKIIDKKVKQIFNSYSLHNCVSMIPHGNIY